MYLSPFFHLMARIFLSAFLFYFSFPNIISMYGFWPCIWFFAVPLLLALRDKSLKKRLGLAVLWGLCAYGLEVQGLIGISLPGFMIFAVILTIQAVIFAVLGRSTGNLLSDIFYFPFIWALSELVRNCLLGGFSLYISHAHAFCPVMLGLYGTVGCLGMSFIIFLVNTLVFLAVIHKKNRFVLLTTAGIIFLIVVGAGLIKKAPLSPAARHLRVAVIQADISPLDKMDMDLFDSNAARHLFLTQLAAQSHPDLVIWPETAFPDDLLQSIQWRPVIFAEAKQIHANILVGIAPIIEGKEYNSALLINASGQVGGLYHKQALIPFAENTPFEAWGLDWGRGYHFSPGKDPGVLKLSRGGLPFGIMICSESAQPAQIRRMCHLGAEFLVEISNDGWFTDKASYMLHAQAAIMRAVENKVWVIRAANTGFSFAVGPDGVIHRDANLKLGREGFGIFDIMVNNH